MSHIQKFGDAASPTRDVDVSVRMRISEGDAVSPAGDAVSPARDVVVSPNFGICDTTLNNIEETVLTGILHTAPISTYHLKLLPISYRSEAVQ